MKKSNIIKIIIIILLLLVVIFISGTSLALPFGGYYNNVFQNKTLEEFFGITWDMVKDKTYGIQSTNDYRDYVYRSTDAYCMDEGVSDAGTGSGGFRARAIIDIEGGYLTIYSERGARSAYIGEEAETFAKAVYLRSSQNKSNINQEYNSTLQKWVSEKGWWSLFLKMQSTYENNDSQKNTLIYYIHNSDGTSSGPDKELIYIRPTGNYNKNNTDVSSVESYNIQSLAIRAENSNNLTAENGTYSIGGRIYRTKIGPYIVSGADDRLAINTTLTDNNNTIHNGIYNEKYLYFTDEITETPNSIKISQSYDEGYKAKLILLSSNSNQARMFAQGSRGKISREVEAPIPEFEKYAVSLEKFVSQVNGVPVYQPLVDIKYESKYDVNGDGKINEADVTYIRRVILSNGYEKKCDLNNDGDVSVSDTVILRNIVISLETSGKTTMYDSKYDFDQNKFIDRDDGLKLYRYIQETVHNHAKYDNTWLNTTERNRIGQNGDINQDGKIDDTDLKIFFSSIIRDHGTIDGNVDHSANIRRYNNNLTTVADEQPNHNIWKKNNPVQVEPGDTVTFSIRLGNTGKNNLYVKEIQDKFTFGNGIKLNFNEEYGIQDKHGGKLNKKYSVEEKNGELKIIFDDPLLVYAEGEWLVNITLQFTVELEKEYTNESQSLMNKATVTKILKEDGKTEVKDSDGTDNNTDMDFLQTKTYEVSLEKYVSRVNGKTIDYENRRVGIGGSRNGKEEYLTLVNGSYVDYTSEDEKWTQHNTWKHDNPATVESGNVITYSIIVRNDSQDTSVYIKNIQDILEEGAFDNSLQIVRYDDGSNIVKYDKNGKILKRLTAYNTYATTKGNVKNIHERLTNTDYLLAPGQYFAIDVQAKVTKTNLYWSIIKNTAEITAIQNKHEVAVEDSTPNNNKDSDYIQMRDITIEGMVWNDMTYDKNQTEQGYDGRYDNSKDSPETPLAGIKVYLYRYGYGFWTSGELVAQTTTDEDGKYSFDRKSLDPKLCTSGHLNAEGTHYIKGPRTISNNPQKNCWGILNSSAYYSYHVVFEYDGITYTSSNYTEVGTANDIENISNAKENNGKVAKTRETFNNSFSTINNTKGITYTTINNTGYIPQSIHQYNNSMKMQSSTTRIYFSEVTEDQLQHVDLGLRGKDPFDLNLTTNVYSTKVTVNGKEGEYEYNNSKVTVRRNDLSSNYKEDAANVYPVGTNKQGGNNYLTSNDSKYDQNVRKTDIQNKAYEDTGLKIEVTYKLSVKNTSVTNGSATRIVDYFDTKYDFQKAYYLDKNQQKDLKVTSSKDSQKGTLNITTQATQATLLGQGQTMDVYVVFTLRDAAKTLGDFVNKGENSVPTFNIAEIAEYKTECGNGQTEFTRGLIDINSAPGSGDQEQARRYSTEGEATPTVGGNPTTIGFYFSRAQAYLNDRTNEELNDLKYEDDTNPAPVLYFVASDDARIIKGNIFEDNTTVNETTKIKSGNGIKDDKEVGVYGATVELIELKGEGITRYTVTSSENGDYTISGFLPGDYIIKYRYGNTEKTMLLKQSGEVNATSYNGEDYRSTNNTGLYGSHALNKTANDWYLYNEQEGGISTATDDNNRRNEVSKNATNFNNDEMILLNNIRAGAITEKTDEVNRLIDKTNMFADTAKMEFQVEKPQIRDKQVIRSTSFGSYEITKMNFGISEVPTTTVNLQKAVKSFSVIDSTGNNTIASGTNENGNWKIQGDVLAPENGIIDISVEDDRMQGAKLTITYEISSELIVERDFDKQGAVVATITGMTDLIDNNLSYNADLGDNRQNWEVAEEGIQKSSIENANNLYSTVVEATDGNPLLNAKDGKATTTITLEKVLSASDPSIEEIITSTVNIDEYNNTVEITGFNYENVDANPSDSTEPRKDRVRTPDMFIILPGIHHDTTSAETVTIHPPTGDSNINMMYYVIAMISLVVLAGGVWSIKKFVIKK